MTISTLLFNRLVIAEDYFYLFGNADGNVKTEKVNSFSA
jgi:hypothetical protein